VRDLKIVLDRNCIINDHDFNNNYRYDIIKGIKEHYKDNWDITYTEKKKHQFDQFIFVYREMLEPALEEPVSAPVAETVGKLIRSRTHILDLRHD